MNTALRFWPDSASSVSGEVNFFFILMVVLCTSVAVGDRVISYLLLAIRYHRKHDNEMGRPDAVRHLQLKLPGRLFRFSLFIGHVRVGRESCTSISKDRPTMRSRCTPSASNGCGRCSIPKDSARSMNYTSRLAGPLKLSMISQDVIHSFFVPAFRTKQDVLPGRYTTTWFKATNAGQISPVLR